MLPIQFKVDIIEELEKKVNRKVEVVIPRPVLEELQKASTSKSRKKAKLVKEALKIANTAKVLDVNPKLNESVDDIIVRLAIDYNYAVATNDSDLKNRLRRNNVPVIYLRQKSFLELEGVIF
jgi:rRNA-processing protein FCF1